MLEDQAPPNDGRTKIMDLQQGKSKYGIPLTNRPLLNIGWLTLYLCYGFTIGILFSTLKKTICYCLRLLSIILVFPAAAQDNPDFAQFFINAASLNPSYVGIDAQPALYIGYRRQWAGVQGGPSLGLVSLQSAFPKQVLGGITVANNSRGLLNTSSMLFTGGYQVKLSEDNFLRFGLSLGGAWNRLNSAAIEVADPNDPLITSGSLNNFTILGNAGVSIHHKTFHAGIAIPHFFQQAYITPNTFEVNQLKPFQSVVVHASNRFYFNKNKNVFEPYAIYRFNGSLPSQLEMAAVVHLQNKVWVGGSFREGLGATALGGVKLNKLSVLGYSYTMRVTEKSQLPRPSHEIQLALLFGKRAKNSVGVYSFVNTDKEKKKKSAAQLAAERKKREELLVKKYEGQNLHEEPPKTTPKPLPAEPKQQVVEQTPKPDSTTLVKETPAPPVERHEFVKRGNNRNELDPGNYVIAGAFRSLANAKKFASDLQLMDIPDADYGFISSRNLWYVYLGVSDDLNLVRAERDHYRQEKTFKDAWILTVQQE